MQGVIKRLRQELIMKGPSKKEKQRQMYDSEDDDSYGTELDEEEKAALNMLSPEQRKMFIELEKAGANPRYLKKKLKQVLQTKA
jgi:DNA-directed RNA polymerase specialized sigma24 family protein